MVGESSPTDLRSLIISLLMFALGFGYVVTYAVGVPLITYLGNTSIATVSLWLKWFSIFVRTI